MEIAYTTS